MTSIIQKIISSVLLFCVIVLGWPGVTLAVSTSGDGDAFYGEGSTTPPEYAYYTNSTNTFGTGTDAATANATINWTIIKGSPTEDLLIGGSLSTDATTGLTIQTSDGSNTNWAVEWQSDSDMSTYQSFDIAFEDSSGDALVVFSDNTATPKFRKYIASTQTWDSSNQSASVTRTAGTVRWVKLATNPGTDTIALVYKDSNNELGSLIWGGSSWGNEPGADLSITAGATNDFDLGWETSADDLMIVSGKTGVNGLHYSTWDGASTWSVDQLLSNGLGTTQASVRVAGDPTSSSTCVVVASLDNTATTPDLHVARWSGTGWTVEANEDTTTASSNLPHLDLTYAGTTGQAVLQYSDAAGGTSQLIRYSNACGAWTVASGGSSPAGGALGRYIQAYSDPSSSNILFFTLEATAGGDLTAYKYTYASSPALNAIAETTGSPITTDTSTVTTEPFGFAFERLTMVPTLGQIGFLILIGAIVFIGYRQGAINLKSKDKDASPGRVRKKAGIFKI